MLTALGDARVEMFSDMGSTPIGSTIQFHEREISVSLLWYMGIEILKKINHAHRENL